MLIIAQYPANTPKRRSVDASIQANLYSTSLTG
jgi:hypothetical protein